MNSEKFVVFLSGIDGSGKTTLAKSIVKELKRKGVRSKYLWYRWTAFFTYPLLAICRVLGYTKRKGYLVIRRYYKNEAIAFLWGLLYPLDFILCSLIKLRTLRGYDVVIIDRFVPDIIVDVIFQTRRNILKSFIGRFLLTLLKDKDTLGVILDINEETALSRKDDIPSQDYVKFRRPIYLRLADLLDWKVLDGCEPVRKNRNRIIGMIDDL